MPSLASNFMAWLKQPFSPTMSAFRWFLFFGLIIMISVAWKLVLIPIEEAVS